jgi:peptide/nickel transport system substrate-binding protein
MVRRTTLAALAVALVAGGLSACGSAESGDKQNSGADTLVIAAGATATSLDPEYASTPQDRESDVSVYDRFTQFATTTVDGVEQADLLSPPEPLLATSYEVSDDGKTYTFHLREGVKSYVGNELTAKDVIWSWDRVFSLKTQGLFPLSVSSISKDSYRALDDYTVEVVLDVPNPLLPVVLAAPVPGAAIYDSTEVKKHATSADPWAKDWLGTHTASFGPYQATEFLPGQQVTYKANPNYYRDIDLIDTVIYRAVPEPANRMALLKAGQVDVAEDLNAEQRNALQGASDVSIISVPGNLMVAFGLNNDVPPFDDVRVRQAVAYAMPIDEFKSTVYFNEPAVRLFKGMVPDTFPGYAGYWPYQPQNLDKAKALVREANPSDRTFEIAYTSTYPEHERIAQLIKTAVAKIGLTAELRKLPPAAYQELYFGRNAESVLVQDSAFVADPAYPLYLWFGAGDGAFANWTNYDHPEVQDIIAQALAEPDAKKREALSREANKAIVDDAPWAMHLGIGFNFVSRSKVGGFVWRPHNLIEFADLSLTD